MSKKKEDTKLVLYTKVIGLITAVVLLSSAIWSVVSKETGNAQVQENQIQIGNNNNLKNVSIRQSDTPKNEVLIGDENEIDSSSIEQN